MASITIYPTGSHPTDLDAIQTALDDGYNDILMKATDMSGLFTPWKLADSSSYPTPGTGVSGAEWLVANDGYVSVTTDVTIRGESLAPLGDEDGDPLQTTVDGGVILVGAAGMFSPDSSLTWSEVTFKNLNFINALGTPLWCMGGKNITVEYCKMSKMVPSYAGGYDAIYGIIAPAFNVNILNVFDFFALDWTDNPGLATSDPFIIRYKAPERERLTVRRCIIDTALPDGIQVSDLIGYSPAAVFDGHSYGVTTVDSCDIRNALNGILIDDSFIPYGSTDTTTRSEITGNKITLSLDDSLSDDELTPDGVGVWIIGPVFAVLGRNRPVLIENNTIEYFGDKPAEAIKVGRTSIPIEIKGNKINMKALGWGSNPITFVNYNNPEYTWLMLSYSAGFDHLGDYVDTYRNDQFADRAQTMSNVLVSDNRISAILSTGYFSANYNDAGEFPPPFNSVPLPTSIEGITVSGNSFQDSGKGKAFKAHYFLDEFTKNCSLTVLPSESHKALVVDNGMGNTVLNATTQKGTRD